MLHQGLGEFRVKNATLSIQILFLIFFVVFHENQSETGIDDKKLSLELYVIQRLGLWLTIEQINFSLCNILFHRKLSVFTSINIDHVVAKNTTAKNVVLVPKTIENLTNTASSLSIPPENITLPKVV